MKLVNDETKDDYPGEASSLIDLFRPPSPLNAEEKVLEKAEDAAGKPNAQGATELIGLFQSSSSSEGMMDEEALQEEVKRTKDVDVNFCSQLETASAARTPDNQLTSKFESNQDQISSEKHNQVCLSPAKTRCESSLIKDFSLKDTPRTGGDEGQYDSIPPPPTLTHLDNSNFLRENRLDDFVRGSPPKKSNIDENDQYPTSFPSMNDDSFLKHTPLANNSRRCYDSIPPPPIIYKRMESITEKDPRTPKTDAILYGLCASFSDFSKEHFQPATFIGGFMSVLYHIVFCLAMASTLPGTTLGTMIMMTASGVLFACPVFIHMAGGEIPAMYPTVDLFLAPFLATLAGGILETLEEAGCDSEPNTFLATFSVLSSLGLVMSGIIILLASRFKLANLASYLPFPVLCGFFTAVGTFLWFLGITVDTGLTVEQVLSSEENLLLTLVHHGPSFVFACIIKIYAPRNPFIISYAVCAIVIIFYSVMLVTGTSVEVAQRNDWLWSSDHFQLQYEGFNPPVPFAILFSLRNVHWGAVFNGLRTVIALSFLYLLRCSLHAIAVKKSVRNLKQTITRKKTITKIVGTPRKKHTRNFTEMVDIEVSPFIGNSCDSKHDQKDTSKITTETIVVPAKIPTIPLQELLTVFSYSQFVAAAVGSFGVVPTCATMPTMYSLGAGKRAPHYFSLFLFSLFYLTNFELVAYIPKMVFSSLIVVAFLELTWAWGIQSYYKIKEKIEWTLVPAIVMCTFFVGLLNAVFLGIGISTFIFVAALLRSGVVKYLSSGLVIRSTIERTMVAQNWLDAHGDKIQIIVLQNYLFFGNASSMLEYLNNMFERMTEDNDFPQAPSRPFPSYIILDLTLVTGMDTSTVDVFNDIKTICGNNNCRLFISGLPSPLRENLALGGFKPERGERSNRKVRFFMDLDTAVGKAEDNLLVDEMIETNNNLHNVGVTSLSNGSDFQRALNAIDEQHGTNFACDLLDFHPHMTTLHLEAGESIFSCHGGTVSDNDRGIFFISSGIMKIEHSSAMSLTRSGTLSYNPAHSFSAMQGCNFQAHSHKRTETESHVRLARVGPGWVLGGFDESREQSVGMHVAVTKCTLYHLPLYRIEEIEAKNPRLVLRLYKLLSYITARRQEVAIDQLLTLRSIMTSPTVQKPLRVKNL